MSMASECFNIIKYAYDNLLEQLTADNLEFKNNSIIQILPFQALENQTLEKITLGHVQNNYIFDECAYYSDQNKFLKYFEIVQNNRENNIKLISTPNIISTPNSIDNNLFYAICTLLKNTKYCMSITSKFNLKI